MKSRHRIAVALWFATTAPILCGDDVHFTLATKAGKTSFRLGEAIEVEFRFESPAPGQYTVWNLRPYRQVRQPEYDHFTAEPVSGDSADAVVDPLTDSFAQLSSGAFDGQLPRSVPIAGAPVIVNLQVNEWLSIRKPGRYRITADTTRVVRNATEAGPTRRSNSIEIDIVNPEPGWAADQLRQAVAVLQIPDPPPPRIGQTVDFTEVQSRQDDAARAARTVRFLETPEAAQTLARFFEHGPGYAQAELHAGLFASPYRRDVMAAMEAAVAAPDVPVTYRYIGTLMELAEIMRLGPMPLYTPKTTEEIRHWIDEVESPYREKAKPVIAEYFAKLANAISVKQGEALAVSLQTLVTNGPQPALPAISQAMAANFQKLPESSQNTLLTSYWPKIASPDLAPMLQSIAEGTGMLRDPALLRLQELNPVAARKITLDRIQKTDIDRETYRNLHVLMTLPDKTLPQAEDALVTALERNKPYVDVLIARYASEAALPRLKTWVEQQPQRMCAGPALPVYFFRVDPQWAARTLASLRQSGQRCHINVSPNEDLLISPGLEKQAIEDLSDNDPLTVRAALTLLQYAGSAAAEEPLLQAFARFRLAGGKPGEGMYFGIEQGFVSALLSPNGWLPSEKTFAQTLTNCATDQCARQVASARKTLTPPIQIMIGSSFLNRDSHIGFAPFGPFSPEQVRNRIAQFPKGTEFYLNGNDSGSWYFQQHSAEARKLLEAAGMKVVERPAPTPR